MLQEHGIVDTLNLVFESQGDTPEPEIRQEDEEEYIPRPPRKPQTAPSSLNIPENACDPQAEGDECWDECLCERPKTCQNINTETGSFVNNVTRDYQTKGPELLVRVPGGRLRSANLYKNGQWMIGPARTGMDGLPREGGGLQFLKEGDAVRGYVIAGIIKDGNITYDLPPNSFTVKDGQYVYTGEQIYLHDATYKITPYEDGWRWRNKRGSWKQYDADGRLLASGTRRGTVMTVLYDAEGKVVGYADRNNDQVIWVDYHPEGRIQAVQDALGRQISYAYDADGRLRTVLDGMANETFTYSYNPQNRLAQVAKPGGRQVNITYNSAGNAVAVLDEQGQGHTFAYEYDDYRNEYYVMAIDPDDNVKETWYDDEGNTKRLDYNGDTVQTIVRDGNALIITDEAGQETRKEYDEWNNLTKVLYPDGSEVLREYDHTLHRMLRYVNKRGRETHYEYDDTGMLVQKTVGVGTEKEYTQTYTYDIYERVKGYTKLGDGTTPDATTTYEYDEDGNLKTIFEPDGDIVERTYDSEGRMLTSKNKYGVMRYTYDEKGNLLTISGPHPETTTP
jgi:YD repeat-containing protein